MLEDFLERTEFKDYKLAHDLYLKAIEINPKKSDAYLLLANLLTGIQKVKEAIEYYKKALNAEPNNAQTYALLGSAHYLDNDIEQAVGAYRSAISISPDNDEYRLIYSQVMEDYVNSVRGQNDKQI